MSHDRLSRRNFLRNTAVLATGLKTGIIKPVDLLAQKTETSKNPEKKYIFLNGGCLQANNHELLFLPGDVALRDVVMATCGLGAKVIRTFATDANNLAPGSQSSIAVGDRIAEMAPLLRERGTKLVIAIANNHKPVPGDESDKDIFAKVAGDNRYEQLTEYFYQTGWQNRYLQFATELINRVKQGGAMDVIFAWEPVNEGHTPHNPEVFLNFFKKASQLIRSISPGITVAPGTMGINHLDPANLGNSEMGKAFYEYLEQIGSYITLHVYDFIVQNGQIRNSGDMPIQYDFALLKRIGVNLPIVAEELGTSRILQGMWKNGQQDLRVKHEKETINWLKQMGVCGWGPWAVGMEAKYGDSWRGITSYGNSDDSVMNGKTNSTRSKIETAHRNLPSI